MPDNNFTFAQINFVLTQSTTLIIINFTVFLCIRLPLCRQEKMPEKTTILGHSASVIGGPLPQTSPIYEDKVHSIFRFMPLFSQETDTIEIPE